MKKFRYFIAVVLSLSFLSTNSYAWGEREQVALLAGTVGVVVGSILGSNNQPRTEYYEERRYYEDRPVIVERHYYNGHHYVGGNPNWRPPVPGPRLFIEQRPYEERRYYYYGR